MHAAGDDSKLVVAARGGDVESYEELIRRHQGLAFRVAYLVLGSADAAHDACQEAFVKAFHSLHRFDSRRPFRPWVLKIVANEARNARKAAARRAGMALRYAESLRAGANESSPARAAVEAERRSILLSAVDSLDEMDRRVITLRYFLELSEEEMALILGCRRGTVKSRLNRSMDRLRGVIAANYPQLELGDE